MELGELLYNKSEYIETVRVWRPCRRWQSRDPRGLDGRPSRPGCTGSRSLSPFLG
uniref:Dynactin 5 n=1 Tax=Mus musculus TaxID=10090 RepID=H3BJ75_MOUSE